MEFILFDWVLPSSDRVSWNFHGWVRVLPVFGEFLPILPEFCNIFSNVFFFNRVSPSSYSVLCSSLKLSFSSFFMVFQKARDITGFYRVSRGNTGESSTEFVFFGRFHSSRILSVFFHFLFFFWVPGFHGRAPDRTRSETAQDQKRGAAVASAVAFAVAVAVASFASRLHN